MCGRISLYSTPERLSRIFDAELGPDVDPDRVTGFNVGPTRNILGIAAFRDGAPHQHGGEPHRRLGRYRWGLVPSWAKDASIANRLFNARGESVAAKPSFRAAFASRRLAVPADGFYEWKAGPGKERLPYYFERADGEPIAFAGLWEQWWGPASNTGEEAPLLTCTIITTEAGVDVADVHHRMPVILERGALDAWLDPENQDRPELESLLVSAPPGTLVHHRVDKRVGSVRNDGPDLIERVDQDG
jgi:putative SOS response-associated peptidase YedK